MQTGEAPDGGGPQVLHPPQHPSPQEDFGAANCIEGIADLQGGQDFSADHGCDLAAESLLFACRYTSV